MQCAFYVCSAVLGINIFYSTTEGRIHFPAAGKHNDGSVHAACMY